MYRTVITYGTFDLFHAGHLNLIRRLSEMAENVIVGVSTDEFNQIKGKKTVIPYQQRAEIVQAIRYVSEVVPESSWDQKVTDIQAHSVDLFAIGDDWRGKFDELKQYCDVVYLPRTDGVSSTDLKTTLRALDSEHIDDLKKALDLISSIVGNFE